MYSQTQLETPTTVYKYEIEGITKDAPLCALSNPRMYTWYDGASPAALQRYDAIRPKGALQRQMEFIDVSQDSSHIHKLILRINNAINCVMSDVSDSNVAYYYEILKNIKCTQIDIIVYVMIDHYCNEYNSKLIETVLKQQFTYHSSSSDTVSNVYTSTDTDSNSIDSDSVDSDSGIDTQHKQQQQKRDHFLQQTSLLKTQKMPETPKTHKNSKNSNNTSKNASKNSGNNGVISITLVNISNFSVLNSEWIDICCQRYKLSYKIYKKHSILNNSNNNNSIELEIEGNTMKGLNEQFIINRLYQLLLAFEHFYD